MTHETQKRSASFAGYQQVYIVKRKINSAPNHNEVFFQCGTLCYDGFVNFDFEGRNLTVQDLSSVPRELHNHQNDLSFLCMVENITSESKAFAPALRMMQDANKFILDELSSGHILDAVRKVGNDLKKDTTQFQEAHLFEFVADISADMDEIECICCKTYIKETLLSIVFFEGTFYCFLAGASGDQPLLEISFPDISAKEGEGTNLAIYDKEQEKNTNQIKWKSLSLLQSIQDDETPKRISVNSTVSLSTNTYGQSYCILKPNKPDEAVRDVLFKFGSWCYSGEAELIPELCVGDMHHIIPALRGQQNKLSFLCQATAMSTDNLFTAPLVYMSEVGKVIETELTTAEDIVGNLENKSAFAKDRKNMFFEFETVTNDVFDESSIDCIATKQYYPNGLVIICIYIQSRFYVCLSNGDENQPLLDSDFPSILHGEERYEIKKYPSGIPAWPSLRKLSLCQNEDPLKSRDKGVEMKEKDFERENNSKTHANKVFTKDEDEPSENLHTKSFQRRSSPYLFNKIANPTCSQDNPLTATKRKKKAASTLGAFHHCPPLKKSSKLEECTTRIHESTEHQRYRG